jgi:hypothetical protein
MEDRKVPTGICYPLDLNIFVFPLYKKRGISVTSEIS